MSLGGYKFAGKYCQKGSLTDQQWALLMHKTRLAAFMASNALSNAGWSFDQTGGDIAFESYGNVIYNISSEGYNHVSFLKHGTGAPTYLAIITETDWNNSSSIFQALASFGSPTVYFGSGNTLFHRLSTTRLDMSNLFNSSLSGALKLLPTGLPIIRYSGYSGTSYTTDLYKTASSVYLGYALKGSSVVTVSAMDISSVAYFHFSVLSGDAFSSLSSTMGGRLMGLCPCSFQEASSSSRGEGSAENYSITDLTTGFVFVLSNNASYFAKCQRSYLSAFYTDGNNSEYPFSSLPLYGVYDSSSKCYGYGITNVDLACQNMSTTNGGNRVIPIANGNLLFIKNTYSSTLSNNYGILLATGELTNQYSRLYVGWDPSNPDITQASAWSLYDGT